MPTREALVSHREVHLPPREVSVLPRKGHLPSIRHVCLPDRYEGFPERHC